MEEIRELLPFRNDSVCRVTIYRREELPAIVICEELEENPGQSVSNAWEIVAETICRKYRLPMEGTVWIEHNEAQVELAVEHAPWQLITFRPKPGERYWDVKWRNMTDEDWAELGMSCPKE